MPGRTTVQSPRLAKRSRVNTNERLLSAALEVFADRGLGAASVEEICERAGFTRGAFYSNYTSKEELFLALWNRKADLIVTGLQAFAAYLEQHPDEFDTVIDGLASPEAYDKTWYLLNNEFRLHAVRHPSWNELHAAYRLRLVEALWSVFERILSSLGMQLHKDFNPEAFTRIAIALFEGIQAQTLVEPDLDAKRLQRSVVTALLHLAQPA